ncbi:MAG: PadR family transcriptional regulator [Bacteroidetes bacterium]|nr:PadR family transcriptional regulator [Bacteroidota bacterium]
MGSNLENSQAQMRKGALEFCILSILEKEEIYPSDIIAKMKVSKLIVGGYIVSIIDLIENGGLLQYRWIESKSGPPRKYYSLTPLGTKFLEELRSTWKEPR